MMGKEEVVMWVEVVSLSLSRSVFGFAASLNKDKV